MTSTAEETGAPQGTQSVQRTLQLLDAFALGEGWLALRDIASRVDLPKPTTHRILGALASAGMVEKDDAGRYRLGNRAVELGHRAASNRLESPPRPTPFSWQTLARSSSGFFREWNGAIGADSYDPTFEREYFAIRHGAGVLDVSPLFLYEIVGPEAEAAAQRIFTRDVTRCRTDQVMYTAWCDDGGHLLQEGNLVRLGRDRFRCSTAEPALRWFQDCAEGFDAEVRDIGDGVAKVAIQGPLSRAVLQRVLDAEPGAEDSPDTVRFFRACPARFHGHPIHVTRTGFTGDLGYELWLDLPKRADGTPDRSVAEALWDALLGTDLGPAVVPMGLAALDGARIEAGLILLDVDYFSASHCLLDERRSTPDEAGLGWAAKLVGGNDFVGRGAIEGERRHGSRWAFVGVEVEWAELDRAWLEHGLRPQTVGRPPSREPLPVRPAGAGAADPQAGFVTSSFFSPMVKRQIGLGSVRPELAEPGTPIRLEMPVEMEWTPLAATVVEPCFFDPPRKRS